MTIQNVIIHQLIWFPSSACHPEPRAESREPQPVLCKWALVVCKWGQPARLCPLKSSRLQFTINLFIFMLINYIWVVWLPVFRINNAELNVWLDLIMNVATWQRGNAATRQRGNVATRQWSPIHLRRRMKPDFHVGRIVLTLDMEPICSM